MLTSAVDRIPCRNSPTDYTSFQICQVGEFLALASWMTTGSGELAARPATAVLRTFPVTLPCAAVQRLASRRRTAPFFQLCAPNAMRFP